MLLRAAEKRIILRRILSKTVISELNKRTADKNRRVKSALEDNERLEYWTKKNSNFLETHSSVEEEMKKGRNLLPALIANQCLPNWKEDHVHICLAVQHMQLGSLE